MRSKTAWRCATVLVVMAMFASAPEALCRPLACEPAKGGILLPNQAESTDSTATIKAKNPTGALLRSLFVPGWGQLYNEKYIKSGLVLAVEGSLIAGAIVEHIRAQDDHSIYQDSSQPDDVRQATWRRYYRRVDKRSAYLWYLAGATFLSMIDAYVDAHLYRFDEGPFGVEVRPGPEEYFGMVVVVRYDLRFK